MKMLVDYDEFEIGKQYCVFDSDLLRFKPDYSKISIAEFDDYVEIAWMLCTWGYIRFLDGELDIQFNRLRKSFRICGFARNPLSYMQPNVSNIKNSGFYQDTKNYKYYENMFSLLNARYGLIEKDQIKQMNAEYKKDLISNGINAWWKDSQRAIYSIIQSVETMDSIRIKYLFGSDDTRKHYYGILTSLSPWSVFINAGV